MGSEMCIRDSLKVSQRSPALPRLPEALRRLYGALQRHGGRAMVQLFDAVGAMVEGGDSVMRSHLSSLVSEAEQPGGGAAAGASLPRLQATASAGAASAYPVLPPNQSFREVSASVGSPSNLAAIVGALSLEPPPPQIEPALRAREWACLLYTSPSPRDGLLSRMPSSA